MSSVILHALSPPPEEAIALYNAVIQHIQMILKEEDVSIEEFDQTTQGIATALNSVTALSASMMGPSASKIMDLASAASIQVDIAKRHWPEEDQELAIEEINAVNAYLTDTAIALRNTWEELGYDCQSIPS